MNIRSSRTRRPATTAVFVAVCLTLLLGFAAFALDGGLIQHNRRTAQAVADSAALAAANDLFINYPIRAGLDQNDSAVNKGKAAASANGFNNDGTTNKVTINIPPTEGAHAGKSGFAEAIVEYYQPRNFSLVFGSDKIKITARAVARGQWISFNAGILVLDPVDPASLNNNGGGLMKVVDADVIVNSNAPDGGTATGSGTLIAPNFWFTGVPGYTTSGSGTFQGNIYSGQVPTPDPLAYLDPPDKSKLTVQANNPSNYAGSRDVHLYPGVYKGGIHVSGQVNVIMNPGIYYMEDGGFSFTGQGSLNANGVMVYTEPKQKSDEMNVNGLGQINWSPMNTGPYRGIALWQDRASFNPVNVSGNGTSQIKGTFYAKRGQLNVTGNGAQDVLGSQYISYKVNLGGNGNFNIQWLPDQTARTRYLYLAE
jgi:hypothetical protein